MQPRPVKELEDCVYSKNYITSKIIPIHSEKLICLFGYTKLQSGEYQAKHNGTANEYFW